MYIVQERLRDPLLPREVTRLFDIVARSYSSQVSLAKSSSNSGDEQSVGITVHEDDARQVIAQICDVLMRSSPAAGVWVDFPKEWIPAMEALTRRRGAAAPLADDLVTLLTCLARKRVRIDTSREASVLKPIMATVSQRAAFCVPERLPQILSCAVGVGLDPKPLVPLAQKIQEQILASFGKPHLVACKYRYEWAAAYLHFSHRLQWRGGVHPWTQQPIRAVWSSSAALREHSVPHAIRTILGLLHVGDDHPETLMELWRFIERDHGSIASSQVVQLVLNSVTAPRWLEQLIHGKLRPALASRIAELRTTGVSPASPTKQAEILCLVCALSLTICWDADVAASLSPSEIQSAVECCQAALPYVSDVVAAGGAPLWSVTKTSPLLVSPSSIMPHSLANNMSCLMIYAQCLQLLAKRGAEGSKGFASVGSALWKHCVKNLERAAAGPRHMETSPSEQVTASEGDDFRMLFGAAVAVRFGAASQGLDSVLSRLAKQLFSPFGPTAATNPPHFFHLVGALCESSLLSGKRRQTLTDFVAASVNRAPSSSVPARAAASCLRFANQDVETIALGESQLHRVNATLWIALELKLSRLSIGEFAAVLSCAPLEIRLTAVSTITQMVSHGAAASASDLLTMCRVIMDEWTNVPSELVRALGTAVSAREKLSASGTTELEAVLLRMTNT
jgi:hypothetical protein